MSAACESPVTLRGVAACENPVSASPVRESPVTVIRHDVWPSAVRGTHRFVGLIGRCTNPDAASRWLLRRLERAPDVAEII